MSEPASSADSVVLQAAGNERRPGAGNWRQSKWLAFAELVVVVLIFIADARHLIPVSKTPFLFARMVAIGARAPLAAGRANATRTWKSLAWGVAAGLLLEAFQLFVSQPLLVLAWEEAGPRGCFGRSPVI